MALPTYQHTCTALVRKQRKHRTTQYFASGKIHHEIQFLSSPLGVPMKFKGSNKNKQLGS